MSIAERLRLNVANRLDTPIHESREAADELDNLTKRVAELERDLATARRDALLHAAEVCKSRRLSTWSSQAKEMLGRCITDIEAEAQKLEGQ